MSVRLHYVCDKCGLYFVHEQAAMLECPNGQCQSTRLWEFTRKDKALEHARHIQRGQASGLFRSARSVRHIA